MRNATASDTSDLQLLTLYEESHSHKFSTDFQGVTLSKTQSGKWTVTDDGKILDEFAKTDFDDPQEWIDHIQGLANHGDAYLDIKEGRR